jgi:hypothetical protein
MRSVLVASGLLSHAPDWAGVLVLAIIGWVVYRGGGGTALSLLREANEVLSAEVKELKRQGMIDAKKIALLEARTDITVALVPLTKALELHEQGAKMRADALLTVLEMVATGLGSEDLDG